MKHNTLYIAVAVGILIIGGILFSTGRTTTKPVTTTPSATVAVSTSAQSDPQDIVPGLYPDPIKNTSVVAGLSIVSGLVENNVDATGKIISDHLEVLLKNDSKQDMTNLEAYYTVTDATTSKSEGYYKKLTGFILKSGQSTAIHFDGKNEVGHFGVNKDGLYFTSKNKLQFDVAISAPGFAIAHLKIQKDAGGAELKD